jgi:hypothetical protein
MSELSFELSRAVLVQTSSIARLIPAKSQSAVFKRARRIFQTKKVTKADIGRRNLPQDNWEKTTQRYFTVVTTRGLRDCGI